MNDSGFPLEEEGLMTGYKESPWHKVVGVGLNETYFSEWRNSLMRYIVLNLKKVSSSLVL